MILEKGNMWNIFGKTDLFLITTNPIIRENGAVVMGRGIALEAKKRFPNIPYDFARSLKFSALKNQTHSYKKISYGPSNIGPIGTYENQLVGYFMVKEHWNKPADLNIIRNSARELLHCTTWIHGFKRIDINFPGIGNGKLERENVLPILERYLPDNVHVWEYD